MLEPHAIFDREFERGLKTRIAAAVNADPAMKARYWRILKPRLWTMGVAVALPLLLGPVAILKFLSMPNLHGIPEVAGIVGFSLFSFCVSLSVGMACVLVLYWPEFVQSVARLPVADDVLIRRGWLTLGTTGLLVMWIVWCLLLGGLAWYTGKLGDSWLWVMLFAWAPAALMTGIGGFVGLVLPRSDCRQGAMTCLILPLIAMLAALWIANVGDTNAYRGITMTLKDMLPLTGMIEAFLAGVMTGTIAWSPMLFGLVAGTFMYLVSYPLFRVMHPIRQVGRDGKSSASATTPSNGLDDWSLEREHALFWRGGMFIERVAKMVLTSRERLAFESLSGGCLRMTPIWFWTLAAMILLGGFLSVVGERSSWGMIAVMASALILMFYFVFPIGFSHQAWQLSMMKDSPFPLLPISGGVVVMANLKVYLVRALFGGFHVFAFMLSMPFPESVPLGLVLAVYGILWCACGGISMLLSSAPLQFQSNILSLFQLRGWLVMLAYAVVLAGPVALVVWLVPQRMVMLFCIFGAVLISLALCPLLSYWLWRYVPYDFKGGMLMQRGMWGQSQREILERMIFRN